jgi:hypothetical protein
MRFYVNPRGQQAHRVANEKSIESPHLPNALESSKNRTQYNQL